MTRFPYLYTTGANYPGLSIKCLKIAYKWLPFIVTRVESLGKKRDSYRVFTTLFLNVTRVTKSRDSRWVLDSSHAITASLSFTFLNKDLNDYHYHDMWIQHWTAIMCQMYCALLIPQWKAIAQLYLSVAPDPEKLA